MNVPQSEVWLGSFVNILNFILPMSSLSNIMCANDTSCLIYPYYLLMGSFVNVPKCNLMLGTFANAIPVSRLIWWQVIQNKMQQYLPLHRKKNTWHPHCISKGSGNLITSWLLFVSRVYIICDNWHIKLISMWFVYFCGGFLWSDCWVHCRHLLRRNVLKLKITRNPSHWDFIISRYKVS